SFDAQSIDASAAVLTLALGRLPREIELPDTTHHEPCGWSGHAPALLACVNARRRNTRSKELHESHRQRPEPADRPQGSTRRGTCGACRRPPSSGAIRDEFCALSASNAVPG